MIKVAIFFAIMISDAIYMQQGLLEIVKMLIRVTEPRISDKTTKTLTSSRLVGRPHCESDRKSMSADSAIEGGQLPVAEIPGQRSLCYIVSRAIAQFNSTTLAQVLSLKYLIHNGRIISLALN